jgi:hypothetical protein
MPAHLIFTEESSLKVIKMINRLFSLGQQQLKCFIFSSLFHRKLIEACHNDALPNESLLLFKQGGHMLFYSRGQLIY